jgi:uridine kinase
LTADVLALRAGLTTTVPEYDFATCARQGELPQIPGPGPVLVEGILVGCLPALSPHIDLRVFVDTPEPVRLARRIERDIAVRGRSLLQVLTQYFATVRPMHERHVEPTRTQAHLVVDGSAPLDALLASTLTWLRANGYDTSGSS